MQEVDENIRSWGVWVNAAQGEDPKCSVLTRKGPQHIRNNWHGKKGSELNLSTNRFPLFRSFFGGFDFAAICTAVIYCFLVVCGYPFVLRKITVSMTHPPSEASEIVRTLAVSAPPIVKAGMVTTC